MTPCECPVAGWCQRHGRTKTPHLHKLCQNDERYRALWDGQKIQQKAEPGLAKQAWSYAKALAKWTLAGKPVRTEEQINEIFESHCQPCEFFRLRKDGQGNCRLCGCKLNKLPEGVKNKIAMLTEGCPDGRWTSPIQT